MIEQLVCVNERKEIVTNSILLAILFGVAHDRVFDVIELLKNSVQNHDDFFRLEEHTDITGKKSEYYVMSKIGFTLVRMDMLNVDDHRDLMISIYDAFQIHIGKLSRGGKKLKKERKVKVK